MIIHNYHININDDKDLIIKRGDPLCYIFFEFDDPTKIPKLIRAKMTPELIEFKKETDTGAVSNPTAQVKMTKDITLGFISSNKYLE